MSLMSRGHTGKSRFLKRGRGVFLGLILLNFLFPLCSAETIPESDELTRHRFSEPHLGTTVHLVFYSAEERSKAAKLAKRAFEKIQEYDAIFSDYRADSEVRLLGSKETQKAYRVSADLFTVIACAQKISEQSGGAFDITLGRETKQWRKRSQEPLAAIQESSAPPNSYRDLKLDYEKRTVLFQKHLQLDLGGIAKGFIADQIMLYLKKSGMKHAAVIIGGETVLAAAPPGKKGWRIGLEDPEHKIIGTLELANTALSTSGDSYQYFEWSGKRQAHLIDPSTREGKSNRLNVTTLAPTAMQADAWATALRILPVKEALKLGEQQPHLEALFIPLGEEPSQTEGFPERHKK